MYASQSESIRAPIIAILIIEAFALIARSYLQLELIEGNHPVAWAKNISYLIVPPILVAMTFPILRQHRHFLAARFSLSSLTLRSLGVAILVGILLRIAYWGQLIGFSALGIFRNDDPTAIVGPLFSFSCPPNGTILLYLLVMSLLVPIIEEVINRGFLLYSFLNRGRLVAVVLSSILFAVFHSSASIPSAFVGGLFLAVFALNSRSLLLPIVAHATFNGLVVLDWLCLRGTWNPQELTVQVVGVGLLALIIAILAMLTNSKLIGQKSIGTECLSQHSLG